MRHDLRANAFHPPPFCFFRFRSICNDAQRNMKPISDKSYKGSNGTTSLEITSTERKDQGIFLSSNSLANTLPGSARDRDQRVTMSQFRHRRGRSVPMKKILVVLCVLIGLLVLAGIAIVLFFDVNAYKPRIESAVSDALGMEFRIRGKAGLRLLPPAGVSLSDVRLRNRGSDLATVGSVRVGVALLPLLHQAAGDNRSRPRGPDDPDREGSGREIQFRNSAAVREARRMRKEKARSAGSALSVANGATEKRRVRLPGPRGRGEDGDLRDGARPEGASPSRRPGRAAGERDPLPRGAAGKGAEDAGGDRCGTWRRKWPPPAGSTTSAPSP